MDEVGHHQADTHTGDHIIGGEQEKGEKTAPEGDAKPQRGDEPGRDDTYHAADLVSQPFADQVLSTAHRCGDEVLERACLLLAGQRQRQRQRGHTEDNSQHTRHHADQRFESLVVPGAVADVETASRDTWSPGAQTGDKSVHASLQEADGLAGGDSICAISDALYLGRATTQRCIGESVGDDQHQIGNVADEQRLNLLLSLHVGDDDKISVGGEAGDELPRERGAVQVTDSDVHPAHVQGEDVGESDQQEGRCDGDEEESAHIASDVAKFLEGDGQ